MSTVITSFTQEGYLLYGYDFMESFSRNFCSTPLIVYFEGKDSSRGYLNSVEEVAGLSAFLESIAPFPLMSGCLNGTYTINYDARMGRKSFMLAYALRQYGGKVFWIDADSITHSKVPETFLDECLPEDKMCCFLGRDGWYYTESGFLGYNAAHPMAQQFADAVVNTFKTGAIFTQKGWHDCYAFDMVRQQTDQSWFKNLSEGLPNGTMHPFVNSVLGAYMDHKKGPRKHNRSTAKDLVVERAEEYWHA